MKYLLLFGLATISALAQPAPVYDISTTAGRGRLNLSEIGSANVLRLPGLRSVAADPATGNVYIGDNYHGLVIAIHPDGSWTRFAGDGSALGAANGVPALEGGVPNLSAMLFREGELYFGSGGTIRKVTAEGNLIIVVNAQLTASSVVGIAFHPDGTLYWSDALHRIRRLNAAGEAETVAGNGVAGFTGDGAQAVNARLNGPSGIRFDPAGNLYIADTNNNRIRRIAPDGVITTFAGTGQSGSANGPIANATFFLPADVEVTPDGAIYVADRGSGRVRRISPNRIVSSATDPGSPQTLRLSTPVALAIDPTTGFPLILDAVQGRVYRLSETDVLSVLAGSDPGEGLGDGGPATDAYLLSTTGVAVGPDGSAYVADEIDHRIRRIDPDGNITTFAGNGFQGSALDGQPAREQPVPVPRALAFDADGNLYIATSAAVRKVTPDGIITRFAGGNGAGYSGDNGPAIQASLSFPQGLAVDADGNVFIADTNNHRVRRVGKDGQISTIAGTGTAGFSGDGGPAVEAMLNNPYALTFDSAGNLLIVDRNNFRVRRITPDGTISTIAGNGGGASGNLGDGGPALDADISAPLGITWDPASQSVFLPGYYIRRIGPDGIISTIAGSRTVGFEGDGGAATEARINSPWGMAAGRNGEIYFADSRNFRLRKLTPRQ